MSIKRKSGVCICWIRQAKKIAMRFCHITQFSFGLKGMWFETKKGKEKVIRLAN